MGGGEHDHRRAHGARPHSEGEGRRRPGHRRVSAQQDRRVDGRSCSRIVDSEEPPRGAGRCSRRSACATRPPIGAWRRSCRRVRRGRRRGAAALRAHARRPRRADRGVAGRDAARGGLGAARRCARPSAPRRATSARWRSGRCRSGWRVTRRAGRHRRAARHAARPRRLLRARRPLSAALVAADDRDSGHVAGVSDVVAVCPRPEPVVMAAALEAGVSRLFRVGGAHAVAALAYGTAHGAARGQDRRPGQPLRGGGQGARRGATAASTSTPARPRSSSSRPRARPTGLPPTSSRRPSTTPTRARCSSRRAGRWPSAWPRAVAARMPADGPARASTRGARRHHRHRIAGRGHRPRQRRRGRAPGRGRRPDGRQDPPRRLALRRPVVGAGGRRLRASAPTTCCRRPAPRAYAAGCRRPTSSGRSPCSASPKGPRPDRPERRDAGRAEGLDGPRRDRVRDPAANGRRRRPSDRRDQAAERTDVQTARVAGRARRRSTAAPPRPRSAAR